MDASSARHLAHTGMLFVPSDSRSIRARPDRHAVRREMADALRVPLDHVKPLTVVIAPSTLFDEVWRAIVQNNWSERLKSDFMALHGDGEIEFVPRK